MKETLKQDLLSLRCEDNVAYLPTSQLNDYPELKKALLKINGKYKRNTFVFPNNAKQCIDELLNGDTVDFKKKFQFFATPPELADRMAQDIIWSKYNMKILEPGAGHGALIDAMYKSKPDRVNVAVDLIELSELNYTVLMEKFEWKMNEVCVFNDDFLSMDFDEKYDLIIANPPFTKNQDIDHIRKMYDVLADNGRIITLSSKSWTFGSQKKQVEFRDWLEDIGATWVELDRGVFKSSGTDVSGMYIIIDK